jgi:hypothetical protein
MPDKVSVLGNGWSSWFIGEHSFATRPGIASIIFPHHLGYRATVFLAQIMDYSPEDDHGELATDGVIVMSIAVVIDPAPCHGVDIRKDIVLRGLWEMGWPLSSISRHTSFELLSIIGASSESVPDCLVL